MFRQLLRCPLRHQLTATIATLRPKVDRNPTNPFAGSRPTPSETRPRRVTVPHRGTLVLILGVLGWICGCPIFSVMAWSLGNSDLREMQYGRMNPDGEGMTRAGQLLGMTHTLLCLGLLLLGLFILILATVAGVLN